MTGCWQFLQTVYRVGASRDGQTVVVRDGAYALIEVRVCEGG